MNAPSCGRSDKGVSVERMRVNQLKVGTALSYLQMGLFVLVSLLYTPLLVGILGENEYGLYQSVSSTIGMLSILNLGFSSAYIRFCTVYRSKNDAEAIHRLNGLFMMAFLIIGLVAFVCGMILTLNLKALFDDGFTAAEYNTARVLMILLTVNLATSFPMSVFSVIIVSHERFVFLKLIDIAATIVGPIITFLLLSIGFRTITMCVVSVSVSFITSTIYMIYTFAVMGEKFVFRKPEKEVLSSLFSYTFFIALNMIVDQINWNVDKIVIGRFRGTAEVTVYSLGYTIYSMYMKVSLAVSSVFTPKIHRIINATKENLEQQKSELTSLFSKVGRIQFMVLGLLASGFVFFGRVFVSEVWMKKGYDNSYYVALILILSATVPLIQNIGIEIQRAQNKHQFRAIAYTIMAAINLVLSVFLCKKYGAVGSTIGTAVSLIVANGLLINIYYHRCCNVNVIAFWKEIARISVGLILPVTAGVLLLKLVRLESTLQFCICVGLYSCVYGISIWNFGMNSFEKDLLKRPLNRLLRRPAMKSQE